MIPRFNRVVCDNFAFGDSSNLRSFANRVNASPMTAKGQSRKSLDHPPLSRSTLGSGRRRERRTWPLRARLGETAWAMNGLMLRNKLREDHLGRGITIKCDEHGAAQALSPDPRNPQHNRRSCCLRTVQVRYALGAPCRPAASDTEFNGRRRSATYMNSMRFAIPVNSKGDSRC